MMPTRSVVGRRAAELPVRQVDAADLVALGTVAGGAGVHEQPLAVLHVRGEYARGCAATRVAAQTPATRSNATNRARRAAVSSTMRARHFRYVFGTDANGVEC